MAGQNERNLLTLRCLIFHYIAVNDYKKGVMVIHFCFYRKSDHCIFSKSFFSAHLSAKDDRPSPRRCAGQQSYIRAYSARSLDLAAHIETIDVPVEFVGKALGVLPRETIGSRGMHVTYL